MPIKVADAEKQLEAFIGKFAPKDQRLIAAAIDRARTGLPVAGRGRLIIRSVSAKQRPRRT